jgi:hypothetical protein
MFKNQMDADRISQSETSFSHAHRFHDAMQHAVL